MFNRDITEHVCFQQKNIAKKEKKKDFLAQNFMLAVNMLQLIYALKKHNN
jgi:hypothetical protein